MSGRRAQEPMYEMVGPSALGGDWRRTLNLALTLAVTDWKLRFFGSVLGYFWSLLRPLMLFGILYAVFSQIVDVAAGVEDYPVQLLVGVVLFSFFGEVTGGSVSAVVERESLVRKIAFPRMVIPMAVVLGATFNLLLNLVALGAFLALAGVEPRLTWLLAPATLLLLLVLATGVAMLLSSLYVSFRDVRPIWDVVLQGLFYATPVIYPIELVIEKSETAAKIVMMSPVAVVIQETRRFLLGGSVPRATDVLGSGWLLLAPVGITVFALAFGYFVFDRMAPRIADRI